MGFIHCVKHGAVSYHHGIGKYDYKLIINFYIVFLCQARTTATVTWRESTAIVTTASASTATESTGNTEGVAGAVSTTDTDIVCIDLTDVPRE